ncbi:MAG: ABC transporter ATP-binding protein, partial [Verrucomicrobiota bacterium]
MTFIVGAVFAAAYGITLIALRGILARCNQEHHGFVERQHRAASEFLHHFKVILLYRAQPVFIRSYQEASRALAANEAPVPVIRATPRLIMEAIAFSSLIAFVLWALQNPHSSPELIPLVGTYVMAGYRLLPSFSLVYSQVVNVLSKTTVTNTLHSELFSAHPPTPSNGGNAASRLHEQIPFPNRIDFQQVTFRYSGEGQSTLENIDFHLHAGEHLGIQGPSGSGKSTFADLLLGLLPPSDGAILHDGKPWHGSSAETQWWPHLGYVPQQIALLDDTLQQNITLGAPVDQDRLEEVLCRTQLKDWFHSLERGWDHPVGEGGAHVSGGQRQRIALARALYRDPKLLILDEATSALDPETETSLLETLHQSCPRGTILTIAHRPNALRHCDRIYELSQGKLHLLTSAS